MPSDYQISAYPGDLALFVRDRWPVGAQGSSSLPDATMLEHLISVCYQASLLREEERPVRFRLIFLGPDRFPPDQGPPSGLQRLLFTDRLPFTERELRKLSPSVDFYGSLVGLWYDRESGLSVWGIVHSGSRWRQSLHGGGEEFQPLPDCLVINVTNPGRITVSNGSTDIATLNAGRIVCSSTTVIDSTWIRSAFGTLADEEHALHREARTVAAKPWAAIDPEFFGIIKKQVFMRILGRIRSKRHGGTLIFIPDERKDEFLSENPAS